MPGQMADAMTGVNAQLADAIRQGKMFGLQGISGTGATMGGLSSQEAARMLQAAMSNQNADLQSQQLSEQSLQNLRQAQLASLSGRTNLYGTTPGMANMFGNQALQAWQNRISMEGQRNNLGMGLLGIQNQSYGNQQSQDPWWKQVLGAAGSVIPYIDPIKKLFNKGNQPGPMGYNNPNGMGGSQFTGFMDNPSAPPGNMTGNVDSRYSFPNYGYSGGGDSYLDPYNWGGWQPGGWGGWDNSWWDSNRGGGMDNGWFPSGGSGNYEGD
jgi:hypothetical protein